MKATLSVNAVLVAVAAAFGPAGARADDSWITFLSHREGKNLLYRMHPGGEPEPLFGGEIKDAPGLPAGMGWWREPHWSVQSPDGAYFLSWALDRGSPAGRFQSPPRYLLHLGRIGSGSTRLITPDAGEVFAWAPDSKRLVYARSLWRHPAAMRHPIAPRTELVIHPLDGAAEEVVLDRPGIWEPCDWSPDGRHLLVKYVSTPIIQFASSALFELDLAEARKAPDAGRDDPGGMKGSDKEPSGGGLRAIRPLAKGFQGGMARYSPDGRLIAIAGSSFKPQGEGLIDASRFASANKVLSLRERGGYEERVLCEGSDVFDGPICWSPDGRRILFARWDEGKGPVGAVAEPAGDVLSIWSVAVDGKDLTRIAGGWCPDWRGR
ncbi:translocation protein TolB [Aquisphaera giovannonii]|uniref:Translocation protein TolB n=1 Tax=Aquisphaera giovannonii TaxID=406548 RepID=A0A5B9W3Y5_9BACT|nr:PD40 domain-containing protein [Aquisphaera giovannonii]QEH34957.1 translocation protein TolB [Aquisphaera giovannonii]